MVMLVGCGGLARLEVCKEYKGGQRGERVAFCVGLVVKQE